MCGIAGMVSSAGESIDAAALARMHACIANRGPDDAGLWHRTGGGAAFAHRRLSILDLTDAGHQPFILDDGRLVMTYNGEIYNFRELRHGLESRGVAFRSQSDTEVILRGYDADGPAFVEKLRGMFAFAIWDEARQSCLLARDQFGIKPLYYATQSGRLVFASTMRALAASGVVTVEPDPIAVSRYFQAGSVPEPLTLLRDVRSLEAGHVAIWHERRLEPRRYWSIRFEPSVTTWQQAVAGTRAALADSVRHHFISDVPVGVFLSGGLDSTALVALAKDSGIDHLHTFSIAFRGHRDDEGALARRTASHFGTTHHEWPIDGATARDLFAEFVAASDQPSIDGLNVFAVSTIARRQGIKVALSGLGADELFGGYKSFRQVPRLTAWHRRLQRAGLQTAAGAVIAGAGGAAKWRRLGESLRRPATIANTYRAFRGIFTEAEASALTATYTGHTVPAAPLTAPGEPREDDGDAISRLELTQYMRNQLLRDADTMSMARGLELRVPFLDPVVFDAVRVLPPALRLRSGKQLLIAAVPEIPSWIVEQPKRGFLFPVEQWLGDTWQDTFSAIDRASPVPLETWYRKWCVFMFERWLQAMRSVES